MRALSRIIGIALMTVVTNAVGLGAFSFARERDEGDRDLDVTRAGARPDAPHLTVTLKDIPILRTVLRPSQAYAIDDEVVVDGYYYRFRVHASHGDYEATSVRHLIKLCREIEVIEGCKASDKENHIWTGAAQAAKGIGVGFANIFLHPGQTAKNIGRSTGRLCRALGAPFRSGGETMASDGTDRAFLGKGPAGGERRLVAYELGLDVYTDNPAAQAIIKGVAKRRFAGKLPLNLGVFALPGGAVFTMALTPMGHDLTTEMLIRDNSPDELKRVLGLYYLNQFGIDWRKRGSAAQLLLDNPNYSPREQAYLGRYLNDLQTLDDVEKAMHFLAKVDSPAKAAIVNAQIELLALLHARAKPLRRFVPIRNTLGAESRDGSLCLVISIDTVRYWGDVLTSLRLAVEAARAVGAQKIEFWSTGDVDEQSLAAAREMGVVVHQNILENPIFQRPRDADPTLGRESPTAVADKRSAEPRASQPPPPPVEPPEAPLPVAAPKRKSPPASDAAPAASPAPRPAPAVPVPPAPTDGEEERDMPAFKF